MNTNNTSSMYETIPVVSELNKVSGFDPLKFLRKTKDGWNLDLKIKKLWFRLKYPTGRIKLTALKITDQLAIIEARVYFDKNDTQPVSSFTSHKENKSTPGGLYIESAQHSAIDEALSAAGFGIQFISAKDVNTPSSSSESNISPSISEKAATKVRSDSNIEKTEPAIVPPASISKNAIEDNNDFEEIVEEDTSAVTENNPVSSEVIKPRANETIEEINDTDTEEQTETTNAYTKDMDVDKICSMMSVDDAKNIIVPAGTCKGWTLSQVAERRPVSLKWYLTGYNGDDNILRAGAKILLNLADEKMAS